MRLVRPDERLRFRAYVLRQCNFFCSSEGRRGRGGGSVVRGGDQTGRAYRRPYLSRSDASAGFSELETSRRGTGVRSFLLLLPPLLILLRRVKCHRYARGCKWTGPLSNAVAHQAAVRSSAAPTALVILTQLASVNSGRSRALELPAAARSSIAPTPLRRRHTARSASTSSYPAPTFNMAASRWSFAKTWTSIGRSANASDAQRRDVRPSRRLEPCSCIARAALRR